MMTMSIDNSVFEKLHKSEAWMYTNVSALSKVDFSTSTEVDPSEIEKYDIARDNPFVVFVNGVYQESHSRLAEGISVNSDKVGDIANRSDSQIYKSNNN